MYGEAVLRASFHAGGPTLGGVPGRLTLDSANALDLASHESSAENLPAVEFNSEYISDRRQHQTLGVRDFA
jgi:hypothetical protein